MPQQVRVETVRVAIHAPAPLIRAGLAGFVALDPRLRELPRDRIREADAIVVAVDVADASALDLLHRLCDKPGARFLMVVGKQWRADMPTARSRGVRAVVWWEFCSPDVFARSVRAVAGSDRNAPFAPPAPPPQARAFERADQNAQQNAAAVRGGTVPPLSPREADVLRLIAAGKQCDEIATELSYSERTVRYILYGAMKRMQVRNRAHAVSYAIRAGLI
ncbi:response regulator transcription factor [Streptomyces sp. NBC_01275]|uniref:helix-turn-helix transcriptional regulator n=1 Tax=Streptomyces sp. NBC_01275 TaxID=2903807 RepID=UPI00224F5BD0|nr:response regulator transcription factor [Streptomyces sp. NBC_01275]MCX4759951.1 response regulator transcription factor [Streptomyces sp. NBC_01275]